MSASDSAAAARAEKPFATTPINEAPSISVTHQEDDLVEEENAPGLFFAKRNSLSASFTAASLDTATDGNFAIVSFGHPLLDIISVRDMAFLKKYKIEIGSSNLVKEEQLPIFKELANSRVSKDGAGASVQYVAGGAAMNTARIVRWLLRGSTQAKALCGGTRSCMVGATGTDDFEAQLLQALRTETVEHCFFRKREHPTGTCAVLVVEGERSLLANLGAATSLTREDIVDAPSVMAAFGSTRAVYMEGFFMNLLDKETCVYVAENCTRYNKFFTFNLSAPYLSHIFPGSLKKLLPHVDVIMGSRIDAIAYGKSVGWPCADGSGDVLKAVVAQLCKMPRAEGAKYTTDKLVNDGNKSGPGSRRSSGATGGESDVSAASSSSSGTDLFVGRAMSATPSIIGGHVAPRRIVVITDGAAATIVGVSNLQDPVNGEPTINVYQPYRIAQESIVDSNGAGDAFSGGFISGLLMRKPLAECVEVGHKSANVILRHSGCTFPAVPPFDL